MQLALWRRGLGLRLHYEQITTLYPMATRRVSRAYRFHRHSLVWSVLAHWPVTRLLSDAMALQTAQISR